MGAGRTGTDVRRAALLGAIGHGSDEDGGWAMTTKTMGWGLRASEVARHGFEGVIAAWRQAAKSTGNVESRQCPKARYEFK